MRRLSPRPLALAALTAVALTGCADVSGSSSAKNGGPSPASSLPPALVKLAKTDVGQYFVTPSKTLSKKELDGAIAHLKSENDVVLVVEKDGRLNVTFRGNPLPSRKSQILKELVAIGKVDEGV